ncbi:UDP-N-acetylmuramate--L-alanine ligase [Candidatus Gottesmanbacteria bacterium RIFCSPLOWO2_01_FULL_46_9]|uniref:UDP-N-acetylmuramate--L-alanine ligase n=1 Tax=Candidatus Gottesmanbacteria bacterium RIFCSPLOWO2_01_FULL_46_9 TaxID=1798394 RepID=A0A1F6B494_9BACT|nr:MAG: UDP-N-acetylmuramate--L-alanine ligase [Candidatus Gottesmanbacteria bacterium RIFCSPLOWO2_01_FULL_46_9]
MKKLKTIDFAHIHTMYFVGIKGIAMAALAVWAKEKGMVVTGSDIDETFPSDIVLSKAGISVNSGFSADHISKIHKPDLVVFTGAHNGRENIEVVIAQNLGIDVLPHGIALGMAMAQKRQISVAGSHGKTTTSAMVAVVLSEAGYDPSYAVGCGEIRGLGQSGHFGQGDFFVGEADEYVTDPTHDQTPRFLWQKPEILVVTNIDYDHPDVYASVAAVQEAFVVLMGQQTGRRVTIVNADDPVSQPLLDHKGAGTVLTYGVSPLSMYRIVAVRFPAEKATFELTYMGKSVGTFVLNVPGHHNILNAAAAAIACHEAGVAWVEIQAGLSVFKGAKRRFEKIAEAHGISFYDDYAHHPKEIQATLGAARVWYPDRRIIAVFQPHTYSRTKKLLSDFGKSFTNADIAVLTDIYSSAREHDTLGINGLTLVDEVKKNHDHATYMPDALHVASFLTSTCKEGDIVIFMGAGDIYTWEKKVFKALQ